VDRSRAQPSSIKPSTNRTGVVRSNGRYSVDLLIGERSASQLKTAIYIKQWPEYEETQQRTITAGGTVEDGVYASEKMHIPALWMIAGW
jgi:phosphotransferase system IIB component